MPWENKVNKETFKVEYDVRANSSALLSAMAVVRPLGILPWARPWRLSVVANLGLVSAFGRGPWRLSIRLGFLLSWAHFLSRALGFVLVSPKTNLAVPSGGLQRV